MERILFLGLTVFAVGNYQDASAEKPTMMPRRDQLVIQEGKELKIECYSKKASVQFSFPEYSFMSPRSSHEIRTADNGASTFLRENAISYDTGWYACATEGVQIENNFKNLNHTHEDIAWIYIYVNSSTPFADHYYSFPKPITVLSGWPAIVPCRPTSPFSDVQLWQNSKIVRLDEKIRFDPRIGFIIEQLIFEDLVMQFHCKLDNVTDIYDLYYSSAKGKKPKMSPNTGNLSIHEGDELRIECYGESGIQFFFPDRRIVKHSRGESVPSYSELVNPNESSSAIILRSTRTADTGWYGCAEEGINSGIQFRNYIDYTRTEINWIYVYVQSTQIELIEEYVLPGRSRVQYVDGNDFKIPCRPTSPSADVSIGCDNGVVKDKRFDSKHGYIVKRELDNSISCCFCYLRQSLYYQALRILSLEEHITDNDDDSESRNICSSTDAEKDGIINDQLLVDGLVQPSLRSQYRNDDPDLIVESISTKDLLCWAWQVTRGMNYLGFRKVVHGDLAARNVLLADNNVIKICDFGLAEILYKNEDYKKLIEDLLPLQWMAVESIRDRVFSTKSDVWSFGILLWEFFTLAETPYYGVHPRHLYQKLSSGYRMSRPKYAPEKIYNMMSDCWKANPALRPSFATLESEIGKQLDNGIHTYYADMSPMYTELSNETADTEKIDYLTMDPSQVKKVSFFIPQAKIESVDIPLDEFCDSAGPSTRRNDVPLELHTLDTHLQFPK